jgi:hypothetical protein
MLCDWTRFDQAEDPVEWEMFRTGVHEAQGWALHRLWTPHFFRDPQVGVRRILDDVEQFLRVEPPRDGLATDRG